MSSLRQTLPSEDKAANRIDSLLGHWLLVAAMILVAAALTIPQLDEYPLSLDSIFSYSFAHGLTESQYAPTDMLENLREYDSNQVPLHYILLHHWGYVAGHSLAAARLISLFCGLLSLAMVYRWSRDFVSPVAGVFTVFVLLCNAFYAFYYAQVRYYTLVVLLAAIIIWLYLRIATRRQQPKRRDYLALLLACYALIATHFFGFLLYLALALYHLLAAPKDRRWLAIVAMALIALLLAMPWLSVLLTDGVERARMHHEANAAGVLDILATWIIVISNGSPLLLAISLVGVVVGWRRKWLTSNPFLLLFPLLLVSIGVASETTGVVSERQMRYMLVGTPIVVGFIAAGLFALYRLRRWLGLVTLLWLVVGMIFMRTADWENYISGRTWAFTHPPWHLISRWMQQSGEKLPTATFHVSHKILNRRTFVTAHLMDYYFGQHGIFLHRPKQHAIPDFVRFHRHERPAFRVVYQTSEPYHAAIAALETTAEQYAYQLCETTTFPISTVVLTYRWKILQCEPPKSHSVFETSIGDFAYYGAFHDLAGDQLLISGAWQPAARHEMADVNLSYQLLDHEWENVAQLDLPLDRIDVLRRFSMDIADVPAGDYRLMAIVYDAQTGERLAWQDNVDWIPEMQQLAEIAIPERAANSS